jgi:hypothetical protein
MNNELEMIWNKAAVPDQGNILAFPWRVQGKPHTKKKTQVRTAISWPTNELSTSQILFQSICCYAIMLGYGVTVFKIQKYY